ncbi:hypothetical protein B0H66DRAFT_551674 [Apodospora peruviana]|uniref:Protein kinase domain-containing protein n=1 Tax=Apodospora peruviana TaxID=516989 RepID=A0AAE0MD88_9PEZI|nr:hypothetical protein B0H66DRAFT_551674 [Apodospora peruviana]
MGAEVRFRDWCPCRETGLQNDLFVMGSVLFELSTRKPPYVGLEDQEVIRLYQAMKFPSADDLLLGKVITKCWMGSYKSADDLKSDMIMTFEQTRARKPRWLMGLFTLLCMLTSILAFLSQCNYVSK